MSFLSDFTTNKTEVFKNDRRTSFWMDPLLRMEISQQNKHNYVGCPFYPGSKQAKGNVLGMLWILILSSAYTEVF